MKTQKDETHLFDGVFTLEMEKNVMNFVKRFVALDKADKARNASVYNSGLAAFDQGHYTQASIDKYYAAMGKAANMDFSDAAHNKLRDYIVDVINSCVGEINK
jgi:hypothetical protein